MFGIPGTHADLKTPGNIFFTDGSHLLDVELSIKEIGIDPFTSFAENLAVLLCGVAVTNGARHLLSGT